MKIDADEKKLLESVERGDWKSAGGGKRERAQMIGAGQLFDQRDQFAGAGGVVGMRQSVLPTVVPG